MSTKVRAKKNSGVAASPKTSVPPRAAKKAVEQVQVQPQERPAESKPTGSPDFERLLNEHFSQEEQKRVEEATESIFGSLLARHGWVRNEHGQMEYVGGEGA